MDLILINKLNFTLKLWDNNIEDIHVAISKDFKNLNYSLNLQKNSAKFKLNTNCPCRYVVTWNAKWEKNKKKGKKIVLKLKESKVAKHPNNH